MLMKDGEAVMPFGVMGGNYQPVGHTWVLSNMIDYGMDPQAAIALPRVMSYAGKMELETTIGPEQHRRACSAAAATTLHAGRTRRCAYARIRPPPRPSAAAFLRC